MQESTGRHAEADEEEAQLRQELSIFLQETEPQMHSQDHFLDAWTRFNTGGGEGGGAEGGAGGGAARAEEGAGEGEVPPMSDVLTFETSNNSFECR